jgi:hypothetical protein
MNMTLAKMLPDVTLTPTDQMTKLGEMSKVIMEGRIKARREGLDAIHTELCRVTDVIEKRQMELLLKYPELVLMAFAG